MREVIIRCIRRERAAGNAEAVEILIDLGLDLKLDMTSVEDEVYPKTFTE